MSIGENYGKIYGIIRYPQKVEMEYMKGTKIIVIDPESEYREMCQNLKGDCINEVGGEGGMINPL